MSDFEQEFRAKMSGGTPMGGVVQGSVAEKKPLDKRWFIIGGLVFVLVAVLIVLNFVNSNTDSLMIGVWSCNDGTQVEVTTEGAKWTSEHISLVGQYDAGTQVIGFGGARGIVDGGVLKINDRAGVMTDGRVEECRRQS